MQIQSRYDVIGLSLTPVGLQEFLNAHPTSFSVYTNPSQETVNAYGLGTTPQTIAVSAEGKILSSWSGAYLKETGSQIEKFFSVTLPSD